MKKNFDQEDKYIKWKPMDYISMIHIKYEKLNKAIHLKLHEIDEKCLSEKLDKYNKNVRMNIEPLIEILEEYKKFMEEENG